MAKGKQKITAQKDTFVKVLRYLKPYWFYLGLSLVFAAVSVALTLYVPKLTGDVYKRQEMGGAERTDPDSLFR